MCRACRRTGTEGGPRSLCIGLGQMPPQIARISSLAISAVLLLFTLLPSLSMASARRHKPAPRTRFFWNRPAKEELKSFMDTVADAEFNHDRVGLTYSLPGWPEDECVSIKSVRHQRAMLQGWRVVRMQKRLGKGQAVYDRAVRGLEGWRMHEGSRDTGIVVGPRDAVVTIARVYLGLCWVVNPCKVSYVAENVQGHQGTVVWSAVAYATAGRHLIKGEERMRVVLHKGTDEVTFDVCSISRGNGPLGQLAFPFTALMQSHFFHEQLRCMKRVAKSKT